jgi:hypothetical protein
MGRHHIIEKLAPLLTKSLPDTEAVAVYLMVEIRKVLDHAYDKKTEYMLLRFYCDWVVHTEKSRNLEHIAPIIARVYADIKHQIETASYSTRGREHIVSFIYMDDLKNEMSNLFSKEGLPTLLFEKESWVPFIAALVQVLVDQPILDPIPDVPRLVLTLSNPGYICGVMEFSTPIRGHDGTEYGYYDFKNAY